MLDIKDGYIDARDLHSKLGIKDKRVGRWIKRLLDKYGMVEGIDYKVVSTITGKTRQTEIEYLLTIETAKEICMVTNTNTSRVYRRYLIESEKQLQAISPTVSNLLVQTFEDDQNWSALTKDELALKLIEAEQQLQISPTIQNKLVQTFDTDQNWSVLTKDEFATKLIESEKQLQSTLKLFDESTTWCISDICSKFKNCLPWEASYALIGDDILVRRATGIYPSPDMEQGNYIIPFTYANGGEHVRFTAKGVKWVTDYLLEKGYELK